MQTHLSVALTRPTKVRGQIQSTDGRVGAVAYHVYILASASGVLYTGVANSLERRVMEHRQETCDGFTKKYEVTRLVYFEAFGDVRDAISREKQIKRWRREKKIALIREMNPRFRDLSEDLQR
jgi:putative endonuclease